jgi:hypothetical protein
MARILLTLWLIGAFVLPVSAEVLLRDGFDGTSLDTSKWTAYNVVSYSIHDGVLDAANQGAIFLSTSSYDIKPSAANPIYVRARMNVGSIADGLCSVITRGPNHAWPMNQGIFGQVNQNISLGAPNQANLGYFTTGANYVTGTDMPGGMAADEWFLLELTDDGTNINYTVTDELDPSNTRTISYVNTQYNIDNRIGIQNYRTGGGSYQWDWIEVGTFDLSNIALILESEYGRFEIAEGADPAGYTVCLSEEPNSIVVVTITADDQMEVSPEQLTFTTLNWNVPQTVIFTAVDDEVLEEEHISTIAHKANSEDENYDDLTYHLVLTVFDNECGMWSWLKGDVNYDCKVDILDLAEFAAGWLGCTTPYEAECWNKQ